MVMLRLKSLVRLGAIFSDVHFNILADIPSIPVDLETSSLSRAVTTCSSAIRIVSGHVGEVGGKRSLSDKDR